MLTPVRINPTLGNPTSTPSPFPTLQPLTLTPTLSCDPSETIVQLTDPSLPPSLIPSMPTPDPRTFIPGLTPGEVPEWVGLPPYGEGFWPNLGLAIIRSRTSRELWLVAYSYSDLHYYVYDRVMFPQLKDTEVFIPFTCSRHGDVDFNLSAVVTRPTRELTSEVHRAWRIDSATLTLNPVPTNDMQCGCFW